MPDPVAIWSRNQLASLLATIRPGPPATLNESDVPEDIWPIVPYAEWWGWFGEEGERNAMVRNVPLNAVRNLCAVVDAYEDRLSLWLGILTDSRAKSSSKEYIAFVALIMASDYGRSRLKREGGSENG